MRAFSNFLKDESGATVVEYALIISATAMALIAVMPGVTGKLQETFSTLVSSWQ